MTEIRKYLEEKREEMIDFLAELVAVKSVQGEAEENFPVWTKTGRGSCKNA